MLYLGAKSVSAFLRMLLNVSWYAGLFGLVLFSVVIGVDLINPGMTVSRGTTFRFFESTLFLESVSINTLRPALIFAAAFVTLLFSLAIVFQLRRIFASLTTNDPFTMENVNRLRNIGLLVVMESLTNSVLGFYLGSHMARQLIPATTTWKISFRPDLRSIFLGLVLLILSEIFRQGKQLKDEVELTI